MNENEETSIAVKKQEKTQELERVIEWRIKTLRRAGYNDRQILELARRTDIDLHLATELPHKGCSHKTALRILL